MLASTLREIYQLNGGDMINELFTLRYYFNPSPVSHVERIEWVIAFAAALLMAGALLYFSRQKIIKNQKIKKLIKPYPSKLITYGIVAFLLLFTRVVEIPYFAMRLWWVVLFGLILFHLIRFVKAWSKKDKGYQKKVKVIDPNDKYLPKKKKRR